ECELCRSGRYNICKKLGFVGVGDDGCFAEYLVVGADKLFAIPDEVTQKEAAVAEPLACGIHATNLIGNLGGVKGKLAVIVGPGIIGIGAFYAAKLAGARKVLVIGRGEEKRTVIEKHGGEFLNTALLENGAADVPSYVEKWSDGALADVVYECAGTQQTLDLCVPIVKPGGILMVMGVFGQKPVIDMNTVQEAERIILTSQAHVNEIAEVLAYIRNGEIDADELVTRVVTLDTLVEDGFEELERNSKNHIKVLIRVSE
ncbi:MAG: zinc-binding dehydrogenase, partial [Firmicutes bacterium]|nr:zinc-binding dehydrogenase [Bacillota bacterium]